MYVLRLRFSAARQRRARAELLRNAAESCDRDRSGARDAARRRSRDGIDKDRAVRRANWDGAAVRGGRGARGERRRRLSLETLRHERRARTLDSAADYADSRFLSTAFPTSGEHLPSSKYTRPARSLSEQLYRRNRPRIRTQRRDAHTERGAHTSAQ
ncbi:hypothetical protein PUN28_018848 [Cardiocondyla obscurior]|uniref:Uncharacterized protein n=1 Tax=Cardiocondyla obscurior TaxID=286306 RepID=A0AAW2ECC1_9HYME